MVVCLSKFKRFSIMLQGEQIVHDNWMSLLNGIFLLELFKLKLQIKSF